jgi:hypothetical protein
LQPISCETNLVVGTITRLKIRELVRDLRKPFAHVFASSGTFVEATLIALESVASNPLRMSGHQRARRLEVGDFAQAREPPDALKFTAAI